MHKDVAICCDQSRTDASNEANCSQLEECRLELKENRCKQEFKEH